MVESKKIMWMLKKALLVLWRHKPRLFSIFLFPILMIALFGYGMGGSIDNIPVVVVKQSSGLHSSVLKGFKIPSCGSHVYIIAYLKSFVTILCEHQ